MEPLNDVGDTKSAKDEKKLSNFSNKPDPNKNPKVFNSFSSFAKIEGGKTESKKVSTIINIENNTKPKGEDLIDFLNTARYFNDEDVKHAPVLILEELSGNILRGQKLQLNAAGLVGGMRKAKDGIAFFGKQLKRVRLIL
jgi:hypothetical protein